ncbi:MAG: hypothetical protein WEB37_11695 [Bacteroidota bacterium]
MEIGRSILGVVVIRYKETPNAERPTPNVECDFLIGHSKLNVRHWTFSFNSEKETPNAECPTPNVEFWFPTPLRSKLDVLHWTLDIGHSLLSLKRKYPRPTELHEAITVVRAGNAELPTPNVECDFLIGHSKLNVRHWTFSFNSEKETPNAERPMMNFQLYRETTMA